MPVISIRLAMWLFALIALGALGYSGYRWAHQSGRDSRQPEIDRLNLSMLTLRASVETANAEAIRRGQEAAQAAKAAEDEQRRRIEETTALVASYEALADASADDYARRLRTATARACSGNTVRRGAVSETAGSQPAASSADGLLSDGIADDLGRLAREADRINGQYAICRAAIVAGREIVRSK